MDRQVQFARVADIVETGNESWRFQHSSNSANARIQTGERSKRLPQREAVSAKPT